MSFQVISYNMGTSCLDYSFLQRHCNPKIVVTKEQPPTKEVWNNWTNEYSLAEKQVNSLLNDKADVYCFQEFAKFVPPKAEGRGPGSSTIHRPLTDSLIKKKFTFIQKKRVSNKAKIQTTDAVIALNPNRFIKITNESIDSWTAIALATDKVTGKRILFVSSHISGFSFMDSTEKLKRLLKSKQGAFDGDNNCDKLIRKIMRLSLQTDLQIIGADMNASPEKWNPRFKKFQDKGFKMIRTNKPTAVNPNDAKHKTREIDYFLSKNIRKGVWSWLTSFFSRCVNYEVKTEVIKGFDEWNTKNNPSDHKPIRIKVIPQKSALTKLVDLVFGLFGKKK